MEKIQKEQFKLYHLNQAIQKEMFVWYIFIHFISDAKNKSSLLDQGSKILRTADKRGINLFLLLK